MKVRKIKAAKYAHRARFQKSPPPWNRPIVVTPYEPVHFTMDEIRAAVRAERV